MSISSIFSQKARLKTIQIISSFAMVFTLSILDLTRAHAAITVEEPIVKLAFPFGDGANIVIEGDLALVSDEQIGESGGGFFVIDISDLSAPDMKSQTHLAEEPEKGIATDIAARGNLAFMPVYKADNSAPLFIKHDGLAVFDISNPAAPTLISNVEFPTAVISDIALSGPGINLFYSSNPTREELSIGMFNTLGMASLIATIDIPGGASCVAVTSAGHGVVVGDKGATPQISTLSIVDPSTQDIIGSVDIPGSLASTSDFDPFGVAVSPLDKFAYVSGGFLSNEVAVIDISIPTAPEFKGFFPTNGGSNFGISIADSLVFSSNALAEFPNSKLTIVDVGNIEDPSLIVPLDTFMIDPMGILVDVACRLEENGNITAITVNGDFQGSIPGTPPGGISIIKVIK